MDKNTDTFKNILKKSPKILWDSWLRFFRNHGMIRACAITYATLFAIIPFFILLGFIAGKMGYWQMIIDFIPTAIAATHINLPIEKTQAYIVKITEANSGSLGFLGLITLAFSFISAMANLEVNMNVMWSIKKNRNYFRKIGVYSPFLIFLIFFTLFLGNIMIEIKRITSVVFSSVNFDLSDLDIFLQTNSITASIITFTWIFIFALYWLIPYTKVKLIPAIISSTFTLGVLVLVALVSVNIQALLFKRLSVIYGSLSVLPFLMIVLYTIWIVILVGSALTFHIQYYKSPPKYNRRQSDSKPELELISE